MADRNIIYIDDNKKYPIEGAGIIFYRFNSKNKMELLLLKNENAKYEDIGGPSNYLDKTYIDVMVRNLTEKTNSIISLKHLESITSKFYVSHNKNNKYAVIIAKASDYIYELNEINFKNNEITWINLYKLLAKSVANNCRHSRISSSELLYKLKEIKHNHKLRLFTKQLNLSPTTSDEFSD